jgi:hypothetical protein
MNDNVTLAFELTEQANIEVNLIAIDGKQVTTLMASQSLDKGTYYRTYNTSALAPGLYLIVVRTGNSSMVTKVVKE